MPPKTMPELTLEAPTLTHLGHQLAAQQVGLWVPTAAEVHPKQLVRLRVLVSGFAPLSLIGEVLEIERGARSRGARVQLGPGGWARLRAVLYDSSP
jgi:hypothetical protein